MRRPIEPMTRRQLIKTFGLSALLLQPVLRNMAYAAATPYDQAPRYVHFFKGGSFYPSRTNPQSIADLSETPIAPLQAHAKDIILFKGMNIHAGSPKSNGYKEEHAAGVYGCATGNSYKYYKNNSYFAYTDHQSIDVAIADHYKGRTDLADVPLASLHIGGGAHSDADNVGLGNRFISFRNRVKGDKHHYSNAIEPIQDAGQVYDMLMRAAVKACAAGSNQPRGDMARLDAAIAKGRSRADLFSSIGAYAGVRQGLGATEKQQYEALIEDWHQTEKQVREARQTAKAEAQTSPRQCSQGPRPTGNGANKKNLDLLSPVHDQMINMIKLAFQLDLTRVVAMTLSGGSSGQTWPSRGVHRAHHTLEHSGDVKSLVKIDTYYAEKFASLLASLKSVDDGGGRTALHNSSVLLGMECWSNSSSGHYLTNVPFVFAGQGGGRFETGRIINAHGRNNNDIHISCLNAAGVKTSTFGLASLCQGAII